MRAGAGAALGWTYGSPRLDEVPALRRHGYGQRLPVSAQEEEGSVKLWTSRWQSTDLASMDVVPVGISRGVPRFPVRYRYRRLMELAPDGWMFGIENDERFEKVYVAKLERLGVDRIGSQLEGISAEEGGKALALLCFEAGPENCHRGTFAAWWTARTGEAVEELRCGASQYRRAAQESLF